MTVILSLRGVRRPFDNRSGQATQPRGARYTALLAATLFASAAFASDLHLEQQQNALDLVLRHHAIGAYRYEARDARRIDDLLRRQRLEQQQLEIEQWQRQRALEQRGSVLQEETMRRRADVQRDLFRQELQLQTQRFQLDQNRLMQSLRPQPLQPAPLRGTLRLP